MRTIPVGNSDSFVPRSVHVGQFTHTHVCWNRKLLLGDKGYSFLNSQLWCNFVTVKFNSRHHKVTCPKIISKYLSSFAAQDL